MLSIDTIQDIATETGINAAFIEKDWYAVQLLKHLNAISTKEDIQFIFSGGTSLSKGYKLIKRFSEDLDFIIIVPPNFSFGRRRALRKTIIEHIGASDQFKIDKDNIVRGDSHRFFKVPIMYKKTFDQSFLRPYLQLEMTFSDCKLKPLKQHIYSLATEILGDEAETKVFCISPIETAADKISALSWRVLLRDRSSDKDDPTIIRHLYDLAALEHIINQNKKTFITHAKETLTNDKKKRGKKLLDSLTISECLQKSYTLLSTDQLYKEEYKNFVKNMSYGNQEEFIEYSDALSLLKKLTKLITH